MKTVSPIAPIVSHPRLHMDDQHNAVRNVVNLGVFSRDSGPERLSLESEWGAYTSAKHVLGCNSGTGAIHMALLALGVGNGDEVITTAFSFSGTVLPIHAVGATPVFVDIETNTYNFNLDAVEGAITERTVAIVAVHIHGAPVDMPRLMKIAEKHNLYVIEDAAQAHGSTIGEKKVGTFGHLGCWSLNVTKILPGGEGGLVSTNNKNIFRRLKAIRVFGEYDAELEPRSYDVATFGWNYALPELTAAIARSYLKRLPSYAKTANLNGKMLHSLFAGTGIVAPAYTEGTVYQKYRVLLPYEIDRDWLLGEIQSRGVKSALWQHMPMPYYSFYNDRYAGMFPVADNMIKHSIVLFSEKYPIWLQSAYITDVFASIVLEALSYAN